MIKKPHFLPVFCLFNIVPPWYNIQLPHNSYYVDTHVWYTWRVWSRGGTMSHKIIPFLVDYIVANGHIDPKISKTIQHSEIFFFLHNLEIKFFGQM